jgi:hypothetical protein
MLDSPYHDITDQQRRQFIDGEQVRTAWLSAERRVANYRGSMYWQQSKGRAYLYREYSKAQRKSLGPQTLESEKIYTEFKSGKAAAEQRFKSLSQSLATHERLNAALRVGRTPNVVIALLEEIRKAGLQDHLLVIGANALFAYEAHVGVRFNGEVTTTGDMDLLWDSRKKITLFAHRSDVFSKTGLIGVLRNTDATFQLDEGKNSAVNSQGYMVDLIKRRPLSLYDDHERQQFFDHTPDDFWASKIHNMDWLLSAPKFRNVVVGSNGRMAEMVTVDPRAFALYKVYLGQKTDRDPIKAPRDLAQARAVYDLVQKRMPQLRFEDMHFLPEKLRNGKVCDMLDSGRTREPSIAEQLGAVPAYAEHSGIIMAVTRTEVIQQIGRGKQVVWNRAALRGALFETGDVVTISKDGLVRLM